MQPALVAADSVVCRSPSTKVSDTRQLWVALNGYGIPEAGQASVSSEHARLLLRL